MNEAGPRGKGATEGTRGWEGAGRQDSGGRSGRSQGIKAMDGGEKAVGGTQRE